MKKIILLVIILSISFTVYALGDINSDGKIGINDYILIRKYILGSITLTDNEQKEADVNGDNKINSKDYILIRKAIVNGVEIKPIEKETPTPVITPTPKPTPVPTPTYNKSGYPYYYKDATADLTIEKKEHNSTLTGKKTIYYVAHLVLSDYTRLHTDLTSKSKKSDGTYHTRKISVAAKEINAILALEGDYRLNSSYGTVRDSVFYSNKGVNPNDLDPKTACYAYYNKETGVMGDCKKLKSSTMTEAINNHELTDTFRFAKNLVVDGKNAYKADPTQRPRQGNIVGYVKPGEFYFVVSEGLAYSDADKPSDGISYGLTYYEKGEILKSLGCSFGAQFDGGGSIILWFMGKQLESRSVIRTERDWLTDYVYFK